MVKRRSVLQAAAALCGLPLRAVALSAERFLSCARTANGRFVACLLDAEGELLAETALPARGHSAAVHPLRNEIVVFARRAGRFAQVLDYQTGQTKATFTAPAGRHFYGHGCYSPDGAFLYTTENDYAAGTGVIGVWSVTDRYRRAGEFPSAGVGPHEMVYNPAIRQLVVANGGIRTHPDSGRAKLNLPTMLPSLAYLTLQGQLTQQITLPEELRHNSIRHLAVRKDGLIAFAMQWQGIPAATVPLLGLHRYGETPWLLSDPAQQKALRGYTGSVAFSGDGRRVVITSPRGGIVHAYDVASQTLAHTMARRDVSGIAPAVRGLMVSDGSGGVTGMDTVLQVLKTYDDYQWDNHLICL